jgi:hypothetical protein
MQSQVCKDTHCEVTGPQPLDNFGKSKRHKSGHGTTCKACVARRFREYRASEEGKVKSRAATKKYAKANPEVCRAKVARWKERNMDKVLADNEKRRLQKKNQYVEDVNRTTLWKRDQGECQRCFHKVELNKYHMDHIWPVSRGGVHSYANTQVLCDPCNTVKWARYPNVWELMKIYKRVIT